MSVRLGTALKVAGCMEGMVRSWHRDCVHHRKSWKYWIFPGQMEGGSWKRKVEMIFVLGNETEEMK